MRADARLMRAYLEAGAQLRLAELGLLRERLDEVLHRNQPRLRARAVRARSRVRMCVHVRAYVDGPDREGAQRLIHLARRTATCETGTGQRTHTHTHAHTRTHTRTR
jgi:hypothetical protein